MALKYDRHPHAIDSARTRVFPDLDFTLLASAVTIEPCDDIAGFSLLERRASLRVVRSVLARLTVQLELGANADLMSSLPVGKVTRLQDECQTAFIVQLHHLIIWNTEVLSRVNNVRV